MSSEPTTGPVTDGAVSRLCTVCTSTFFSHHSLQTYASSSSSGDFHIAGPAQGSFHTTVQSLQISQAQKCPICCTFAPMPEGFQGESSFSIFTNEDAHYHIEIEWDLRKDLTRQREWKRHWLYVQPAFEELKEIRQVAADAHQDGSTDGENVGRLVACWLDRCLRTHATCGKNLLPGRYPTRLLDITTSTLRLIDTRRVGISGPYATLSHRWGSTPFLVLGDDNLAAFEAGMPLTSYPKTFQDVVVAAQKLKIQFLWIDSCCIIQTGAGAVVDKQREIAQMAEVYSHSLINFGASAASGPHDGCVKRRAPVQLQSTYIRWCPRPGTSEQEFYVSLPREADNIFERLRKGSPLMGRAWVLQERLLCSRMLHLGEDQVHWECNELPGACDKYPEGLRPWSQQASKGPGRVDFRAPFMLAEHGSSRSELLRRWAMIVPNYSALGISNPTEDKLTAVGAVAKRIGELLDDEYIAGLFRGDFVAQLTWQVEDAGKRPKHWRAPSWSWASVDGFVESYLRPEGVQYDLVSLLEHEVVLTDRNNRYGSVRSAWIKIEGRVIPVSFASDTDKLDVVDRFVNIGQSKHQAFFDDSDTPRDSMRFLPTGLTQERFLAQRRHYSLHVKGLLLQEYGPRVFRRLGVISLMFSSTLLKDLLSCQPRTIIIT